MSATLVETLPACRPVFDLAKALETYSRTHNTYAEGSLTRGVFNRPTQMGFEAKLAGRGVQRMEYEGKISYVMPVTLNKKDLKALYTLGNRLVEEATRQTEKDEDKWEYVSSVRADKPWYIKIKLDRKGDFIPAINGGDVNRNTFEMFGQGGESVEIVGTFGIWMNPERGQYGIKFDAQRIDF